MQTFKAIIEIIGVNPFVFLPENVLQTIFNQARKEKGKIPVKIKMDGYEFTQTLIKYSEQWRLYLNTPMRKATGKDVGDIATFEIEFDPNERSIAMHLKLAEALQQNNEAKAIFDNLRPSLQLEIVRCISRLKRKKALIKM